MREDGCGFERLEVWKKAIHFAGSVYGATRGFPRDERFGLTMQLRRAAVSVAANIAEGVSRSSGKDQASFLEIAYGSASEVITMLFIASGQGMLEKERFGALKSEAVEISRMLSGLRRSALVVREPDGPGYTIDDVSELSTLNFQLSTREVDAQ